MAKKIIDRTKYVNDYDVNTVVDKNGHKKDQIVYKGVEIPFLQPAKEVTKRLIVATIFSVLSVACVIGTQAVVHGSQNYWAVLIPLGIALLPSLYLIMGVAAFQFDGCNMTRKRYEISIIRVFKSGAAIVVLSLVAFAGDFIYRITSGDWLFLTGDWIYYVIVLAAFGFSLSAVIMLRTVDVDERELITSTSIQ